MTAPLSEGERAAIEARHPERDHCYFRDRDDVCDTRHVLAALVAAEARAKALAEAGHHAGHCPRGMGSSTTTESGECSCGWRAALAAYREAGE